MYLGDLYIVKITCTPYETLVNSIKINFKIQLVDLGVQVVFFYYNSCEKNNERKIATYLNIWKTIVIFLNLLLDFHINLLNYNGG